MKFIGSALNHSKMNYNNFSNMRKFSIGSTLNHSKMNYNTFSNKKPDPSELFFENLSKISYDGIFNENYFKISSKETKLLLNMELSKAKIENIFNKNENEYYIGLICKSKYDGEEINEPLDLSIALDISGSMNCPIDMLNDKSGKSRIDLAKSALSKLIINLRKDDKMALNTFNDLSKTIFPLSNKEEILNNLELIKNIYANGGTNLTNALNGAIENIIESKNKNKRIILITDMLDNNPDKNLSDLVKKCVNQLNIYITIVAIGSESNTSLADYICKEKGCNYFNAVEDSDLEYFLVKNFRYITFPLSFDFRIEIEKNDNFTIEDIIGIKKEDNQYYINQNAPPQNNNNNNENNIAPPVININEYNNISQIIFEENSIFPSELTINKGEIYEKGGLILIKIKLVNENIKPNINLKIFYTDIDGEKFNQNYSINLNDIPNNPNYFSNNNISTGISLYYYGFILKDFYKTKKDKFEKSKYNEKINICKKLIKKNYKTYDYKNQLKSKYLKDLDDCVNYYDKPIN